MPNTPDIDDEDNEREGWKTYSDGGNSATDHNGNEREGWWNDGGSVERDRDWYTDENGDYKAKPKPVAPEVLRAKASAELERKIPTPNRGFTFERFAATDENAAAAVEGVKAWLEDPTRNLILWGGAGVGKTTLAGLVARSYFEDGIGKSTTGARMLEKVKGQEGDKYGIGGEAWTLAFVTREGLLDRSVEWLHVNRAIRALKASFNGSPAPKWNLSADLLVLDDLGAERSTTWTRDEVVGAWIYDRYDAGRPLLATSNFAPNVLAKRLAGDEDSQVGKRLVSRLVGEGAVVLEVKGGDRRL